MTRRSTLLTAAAVLLSATIAFSSEIKIGGGGASIASVFAPVKSAFESSSSHNLINLQSTPAAGLKDLLDGKLDAAVAAAPLSDMIAGAVKAGARVDMSSLQSFEVALNKTVVLIHPSNSVSSLDKEQMKGLFTGKIANWKEVGGKDEPVLVIWGKNTPGQNNLFTRIILDGEKITGENLETTDYRGIKDSVSSNPGAIGIGPLGMVDTSVKAIKPNPETNCPIILVTKGPPSVPVKQLLDFIKADGKRYIKE